MFFFIAKNEPSVSNGAVEMAILLGQRANVAPPSWSLFVAFDAADGFHMDSPSAKRSVKALADAR